MANYKVDFQTMIATQEEIAKQKQVLHEATQAAEQAWEKEKNKTAGQHIKWRNCNT